MKAKLFWACVFLMAAVSTAAASEFSDLTAEAKRGAAMPQYMLARMYENGEGTPRNLSEAAKWYEASANGGITMAQNRLGEMYRDGIGVRRDKQTAIRWFERAAKGGLPQAIANLEAARSGIETPGTLAEDIYGQYEFNWDALAKINLNTLNDNSLDGYKRMDLTQLLHGASEADGGRGSKSSVMGGSYLSNVLIPILIQLNFINALGGN
jgi:TPR repeat protein